MAAIEGNARTILEFLAHAAVDEYGRGGRVTGVEIAHATGLSVGDINLAVELLGERRQVRLHEDADGLPYEFASVELTTAGRETADSTISSDAARILAHLCDQGSAMTGQDIEAAMGLTPARINHAIEYLAWRGYVSRLRSLGTAPYTFKSVQATASGARKRALWFARREAEVVPARR